MVTGGTGFIGTHLVERLAAEGTNVIALDNFKRSSAEKLAETARHSGRVRLVEGDVRDYAELTAAMAGCEVVFHLAAQSNVMGAVDDPDYSITTNVLGTYNVLRAAAAVGARRLVFTSSREVYGDPKQLPVAEDHPLLAKNAYGASKVAGEAYCRSFAASHRLDIAVLRLANVYGAGDSGRVIPLWISAARANRDLSVYGGDQVIDFLWVGTAVEALLHAARHGVIEPTNIGSGRGTQIMDLAARIIELTGSSSRIIRTPAREIEVARFIADTSRMRALGLEPDEDPLKHLGEILEAYPAQPARLQPGGGIFSRR